MNAESMPDLHGKRLLVVFGSYRSKRHIFEHARSLGVDLVVIDGPDHWAREEAGPSKVFERHIAIGLAPFETLVERALTAVRETGLRFDGIGAIDEFAGGFAARIAAELGLTFHAIDVADKARDKHRARAACSDAGLPGPRFARVESVDHVAAAAVRVGFPAVLKPISGVGSVQTFRVADEAELRSRFLQIASEARSFERTTPRTIGSDRGWFDLMWSGPPHLTLESWIEGPKFDVDLLIEDGRVVYAHATDDVDLCGLRDIRRAAPTSLSDSQEAEMVAHAADCVRAIGFRRGAFNVEVKLTAHGPRMIEVNGRLGGYSTTDIHREVWSVDLIAEWLRSSLGLPHRVIAGPPRGFVAESLLPAPRSGTVSRDGFLDHLQGKADIVVGRQWTFAGDAVAGVETNAPDWLGAVVARGATRDEAMSNLDRAVRAIEMPIV